MDPIGIFGGTFDPIHYGHLRTAYELYTKLDLGEVRFIPSGIPPHRAAPVASGALRLRMVVAAIAGQPGFVADDREVQRAGPSYSVDTLSELRAAHPHRPLCLLLGMDAFLGITAWYRWQQVLELAHVVVVRRPGWQDVPDGVLGELVRARASRTAADLSAGIAGRIHLEQVTQLEISSATLRATMRDGEDGKYLVPDEVLAIAGAAGCYA
jgi:nicotinate-nucleotide adenylyltransferase